MCLLFKNSLKIPFFVSLKKKIPKNFKKLFLDFFWTSLKILEEKLKKVFGNFVEFFEIFWNFLELFDTGAFSFQIQSSHSCQKFPNVYSANFMLENSRMFSTKNNFYRFKQQFQTKIKLIFLTKLRVFFFQPNFFDKIKGFFFPSLFF